MQKRIKKNFIWPVLFGMGVLGILTWYKLNFGMCLLESDSASDIVYAHLLSEEGSLVSDNWYFGAAIRILDNELLFAGLFKLFPQLTWWEIETLGTAIMNAFLGLSSVALAYQLGLGRDSLWMFGFSLLPYGLSEFYYVLMHGCGYYVAPNFEVFVILALYLAVVTHQKTVRTQRYGGGVFACFLILSLVVGLRGVRLLECLYAPLLLSNIAIFAYGLYQNKDKCLREHVKDCGGALAVAIAGVAMACVGWGINKLWLTPKYLLTNVENLRWKDFSVSPLETLVSEIMSNLGYIVEADLFTGKGITNFISIVFGIVILCIIIRTFKERQILKWDYFIVCFFVTALLVHTFIYVFLFREPFKARYMLPFFMLFPHVICVIIKKYEKKIAQTFIVLLVVCSVLVSVNMMFYGHARRNHQWIDVDKQKEMADYLVENGYQYGFATFWYTNSTIQLSNGNLEIVALVDLNKFEKYECLCVKDEIKTDWSDKTFLIVSSAQMQEYGNKAWNQENRIIWHSGEIYVFTYESVEELQQLFVV